MLSLHLPLYHRHVKHVLIVKDAFFFLINDLCDNKWTTSRGFTRHTHNQSPGGGGYPSLSQGRGGCTPVPAGGGGGGYPSPVLAI